MNKCEHRRSERKKSPGTATNILYEFEREFIFTGSPSGLNFSGQAVDKIMFQVKEDKILQKLI